MEIFNVSLSEIKDLKRVGSGEEAVIYLFSDDKILKLYRTPKSIIEKRITVLSLMQPLIKNTHLPLGTVYFNDRFVGCMHTYHKNALSFDNLRDSSDDSYQIDKFRQLNDNINELICNNIYYDDLDSENVLITSNNKVELIDTDSAFLSINQIKNNKHKINIYKQFKSMIIECLFKEEYFFNDNEVFSRYNIKNEYIDKLISDNISYELFNEFFDYLEKDKILILQQLNTRDKRREV